MKIALFGRKGQVATEIRRRVPDGVTLEVIDRERADFLDPESVREVARSLDADAVINAVAYTQVDKAETDVERALTINATSVGALGEGCAESGAAIIHISTDYVFGGDGTRPWQPDDPIDPKCVYGATKAEGERALHATHDRFAILRTSWVFSSHRTNFVKTMLRLGSERECLKIVSDQVGGPTPAADIADACLNMAVSMADGHLGGTYHFSGAPDVSWIDFAREIFRQSGQQAKIVDVETEQFPRPAVRPQNSRLDCSTLEADFGIVRPDWRVGLEYVLEDLRN